MATATTTKGSVSIALNKIKVSDELQARVEMDPAQRERISRTFAEHGGFVSTPVDVFLINGEYWLVDGFHRWWALYDCRHLSGCDHISCVVHEGDMKDAVVFAATANVNNTSVPLTNEDRKRSMWMLMDNDPALRSRSSTFIGNMVGLCRGGTSRRCWLEWFNARGIPVPDEIVGADGRVIDSTSPQKTPSGYRVPKEYHDGDHVLHVEGRRFNLGHDKDKAAKEAESIQRRIEQERSRYDGSSKIRKELYKYNLVARSIWPVGTSQCGFYGIVVNGVAATWEPFREKTNGPAAIGRALAGRAEENTIRAVILCPLEFSPEQAINFGQPTGVEFMTIEDFVASLKPEAEPPA